MPDAPRPGQAAWYAALNAALADMAGLTDAEAAEQLRAQTRTIIRDVPTADARGVLFTTGEWSAIAVAAAAAREGSRTDPAAVVAITVEDSFRTTEVLEVSRPEVWASIQQSMAALVAGDLISAATAALLLGLREQSVPVWDPAPTAHDVAHARQTGA